MRYEFTKQLLTRHKVKLLALAERLKEKEAPSAESTPSHFVLHTRAGWRARGAPCREARSREAVLCGVGVSSEAAPLDAPGFKWAMASNG